MRREFFKQLHKQMKRNTDIWAISCDLGWGGFDRIAEDFPERYINVGAAEQAGMDIAIGLALQGKIPFIYSITPFLLYRPFEALRTYIDRERIPVKMIGSGRKRDYRHDGFSHDATDDLRFVKHFKNINSIYPSDKNEIEFLVDGIIEVEEPFYINLAK